MKKIFAKSSLMYPLQDLTGKIISAAIEVHKNTGPGLLEAVYSNCLCVELELRGLSFEKQLEIPFLYKNRALGCSFRLDFLVESRVVVELKSVEKILSVHEAQLLTYLKLSGRRVGLLINFNVPLLKDGIHRRILGEEHVNNDELKNADYTEKTEPQSTLRN